MAMSNKIHKFYQNGMYILLDVNSSTVHLIDKTVYDVMDYFDGTNDEEVIKNLADKYDEKDLREILEELHELMERGELFAPDIDVPPYFGETGLVKSMCLLVAEDCNLRCKYCFAGTGDMGHDRRLMTKEVGKAAVDYIIAHSGKRKHCEIDFFGGEPLVNMPVVKYVTEYVRQKEKETGKVFKLTLTTNGVLLNEENIKNIVDIMLSDTINRLKEKEIFLDYDKELNKFIADKNENLSFGARPIRRIITREIEDKLSDEMLKGEIKRGDRLSVCFKDDELIFSHK